MRAYASCDRSPETDGHRVPDQPTERLDLDLLTFGNEGVVARKGLDQRTFAQRNRAVLLGVTEASVAEAKKLRGDRRRRFVPFHTSVDRRISLARLPAMARC